ncbi:hypothetical protein B0H17DRAFT_1212804 [Mycena rosella]|uniref:Uncharacterized protein n=1 Tax=Mycena rosella TaxID=1033263 RepID=A0AAD7CRF8_MYCRO|nr:hypothetical protein B0H17DRAFT_1212804 [Mycena rosella]
MALVARTTDADGGTNGPRPVPPLFHSSSHSPRPLHAPCVPLVMRPRPSTPRPARPARPPASPHFENADEGANCRTLFLDFSYRKSRSPRDRSPSSPPAENADEGSNGPRRAHHCPSTQQHRRRRRPSPPTSRTQTRAITALPLAPTSSPRPENEDDSVTAVVQLAPRPCPVLGTPPGTPRRAPILYTPRERRRRRNCRRPARSASVALLTHRRAPARPSVLSAPGPPCSPAPAASLSPRTHRQEMGRRLTPDVQARLRGGDEEKAGRAKNGDADGPSASGGAARGSE